MLTRGPILLEAMIMWRWFAGVAVLALTCAWSEAGEPPAKHTLKPQYREGMVLSYRWDLQGRAAWSPQRDDIDWLQGQTHFEFDLVGRTLRDDGSLTFLVQGSRLAAEGESNKGKLGIEATPDKARLRVNHEWTKWGDLTPLRHEMTITLGSLFDAKLSTGLGPLAPYFLPQVDWKLWHLATRLPDKPVAVGDAWEHEFDWPVPHASKVPLHVQARWTVLDLKTYKGAKVLPVRLEARLSVSDAPWVLDNGERVQMRAAVYEALATAYWHLEQGVLCYADAAQKLTAYAQSPDTRRFEHEATSKLELVGAR
jgi:hypothetical protein